MPGHRVAAAQSASQPAGQAFPGTVLAVGSSRERIRRQATQAASTLIGVLAKSSTVSIPTALHSREIHFGQPSWPNLLLGRRLKGLSRCLRKYSDDCE